jgi:hypothetical protein
MRRPVESGQFTSEAFTGALNREVIAIKFFLTLKETYVVFQLKNFSINNLFIQVFE